MLGLENFEGLKILSRDAARAAGLKRYFTGKRCKSGHVAERNTKYAGCLECGRLNSRGRKHGPRDPAKVRATALRGYQRNRSAILDRQRAIRERRGQVSMAEYRARVGREKEARRLEKIRLRDAGAPARAVVREVKRAAQRIASAALREARAERGREQARRWRQENPERYRELLRAWKKRNRPKVNARKVHSREKLKAGLMKAQKGRCAYCRTLLADAVVHVDHIMPLALGGINRRSNFQLTCEPCNLAKSAHHPVDFARSIGRLI